jgi:opacity protein-like surface antigen
MSLNTRLLASCVATLAILSGAQAFAADYDPPIFIEEAPEWVPVEIGSGWYLRGDVSYNLARPIQEVSFGGRSTVHTRFGGDVGIGYHLNDNFRGDITFGYLGGDSLKVQAMTDTAKVSSGAWNGLVNVYVDLGTIVGLTPYLGVGAGVTYLHQTISFDAPSIPLAGSESRSQYNFAYALMAGASYKVSENTSIDAGYRFLNTPGMEYYDIFSGGTRKGAKEHQIKVGLRYELW